MKYTKTCSCFQSTDNLSKLQPGQWVDNGGSKGVFLGVKSNGIVVVAWQDNARASKDYRGYVKALREYAKG